MTGSATTRGFTLLEVLAALTVLSLALGAAVAASGKYTDNTVYLRDKTLAHWVALNVVTGYQLMKEPPVPDTLSGRTVMAGRDWVWHATISDTDDRNVRRVEVQVVDYLNPPHVLISASGFLNIPLPGGRVP